MDRHHAFAAVGSIALALTIASPSAEAQIGMHYYRCGPGGMWHGSCTSGSATQGCAASGCHNIDPKADRNRVLTGAGSTARISAWPDPGMQAIVGLYSASQLQAVADYLRTLVAAPPPPPPPPAPPPSPPPPPPPTLPPPGRSFVIEYFHTEFGHYFITSNAAEIAALDSGHFAGWRRTGYSFSAHSIADANRPSVCRFFTTSFAPKSSHFYTSHKVECDGLRESTGAWTYEADAFWVDSANPLTGSCPSGTRAVYRLYNNGLSGAPNHRYTTDPAVRADMMAKGWLPEGYGPEGVGFCAPN